ncbi:hypothetical protein DSM104443_03991 [Usitatibacter rugosus]|uniref:Lipoprotein n=1 Tax=Usitatibacter rugosus TaxID=2732067 RepID=A0A6M4H4P2_9PROT|nr:hypothetical protein [Usitatibacter rugosus]QJR12897.1 hypothetical protein DSM104443_03991 [Usitatibacter rugosus]
MKIAACVVLAALLASCGGIPLRSVPQLVSLQGKLLDANPAEFMLAVQADTRLSPKADQVPVLRLSIKPREPGSFEAVDKALPMRLSILQTGLDGLEPAPANRRWFLYSFSPESQAELSKFQAYFRKIRDEQKGKGGGGGSVSVSISQEGVAARDPALADTRWESWLRVSRADGFFEIWSGTIGDLLAQADKSPKQ